MPVKLLAFDPGKTTGWFLLEEPHCPVAAGELPLELDRIVAVLDRYQPDEVVVEAFRLYPWRSKEQSWSDFPAVRVIGAVQLWCVQHRVFCLEQSASCKRVVPVELLRRTGASRMTRGLPHARDAARHALYRATQRWPEAIWEVLEWRESPAQKKLSRSAGAI